VPPKPCTSESTAGHPVLRVVIKDFGSSFVRLPAMRASSSNLGDTRTETINVDPYRQFAWRARGEKAREGPPAYGRCVAEPDHQGPQCSPRGVLTYPLGGEAAHPKSDWGNKMPRSDGSGLEWRGTRGKARTCGMRRIGRPSSTARFGATLDAAFNNLVAVAAEDRADCEDGAPEGGRPCSVPTHRFFRFCSAVSHGG